MTDITVTEWLLLAVAGLMVLGISSVALIIWLIRNKQQQKYQREKAIRAKYQQRDKPNAPSPTLDVSTEQPKELPKTLQNFRLLVESDLSEEARQHIIGMASNSTNPKKILSNMFYSSTDTVKFAKMLASDPEIAARLLRVVNSAAYGLNTTITSVQHAVTYLGINLVKNIIFRSVFDDNQKTVPNPDLDAYIQQYWLAGFSASLVSMHLARRAGLSDPSSISTRALLSFMGNLTIATNYIESHPEYLTMSNLLERTDYEQKNFHLNSAIVGSLITNVWELPEVLVNGIQKYLIPLSTAASDYPDSDIQEVTICYFGCRLGEHFAMNTDIDFSSYDFKKKLLSEHYYLDGYIARCNLHGINEYLHDTVLISELKKVLTHFQQSNR